MQKHFSKTSRELNRLSFFVFFISHAKRRALPDKLLLRDSGIPPAISFHIFPSPLVTCGRELKKKGSIMPALLSFIFHFPSHLLLTRFLLSYPLSFSSHYFARHFVAKEDSKISSVIILSSIGTHLEIVERIFERIAWEWAWK